MPVGQVANLKTMIAHIETGGYGTGDLIFAGNADVDTTEVSISDEHMRITSAGDVGIGTTSPIGKFNIEQGMTNYSESFISPHLLLSTTDVVDAIGFVGIGYESSIADYYGWTSGALRSSGGLSDFVWKFHSYSDSGDERMRILSTGEVGIGTTTPNTKLEVNGIIKTTPRASATCDAGSEGGIYYDSDDNNFYGCNSTDWVQLNN